MSMSIEQIKAMIAAAGPQPPGGMIIDSGHLKSAAGAAIPYSLYEGWDIITANSADETWGVFNVQLMRHISRQGYSEQDLRAVLDAIQVDDSHWRWLDKSLAFRGDEYRWFFLIVNDKPQAACLIYHPKPSAYNDEGVYYIEFVAVAPWNRNRVRLTLDLIAMRRLVNGNNVGDRIAIVNADFLENCPGCARSTVEVR